MQGLSKQLGLLKGLKLKDLAPEAPSISNFITGEVMGHSSDRLADKFGVTRQESDEFALRSHHNAAKAHADGLYDDEVLTYNGSRTETGVRGESSMEKLSSLKPAFVKPFGTVTAANASYLTDGASATLIMSEARAVLPPHPHAPPRRRMSPQPRASGIRRLHRISRGARREGRRRDFGGRGTQGG